MARGAEETRVNPPSDAGLGVRRRMLLRDQMKMQLGSILLLPAIDDESVGGEVEFIHEGLDDGIEVGEEGGIRGASSVSEAAAICGMMARSFHAGV